MFISITVLHSHEITVYYVPDVAFVSALSILYCPFCFLTRLYPSAWNALKVSRRRTKLQILIYKTLHRKIRSSNPIHNSSVLFLLINDPEKNKISISFIEHIYRVWGNDIC